MNHTKLVEKERELIQKWLEVGVSQSECARRLGRSRSTVSREIRRNSSHGYYVAVSAQVKANNRRRRAWEAKHPLKNKKVYSYVIEHLRRGWSPEQIAGRLRLIYSDPSWHISHEAIYQFIYHKNQKHRRWWEYLRRKQKRRRHKRRKTARSRIPDRVSIHERPIGADNREPGHWEGDSIVGLGHRNGLHTTYERSSGNVGIEYMPDLTAKSSELAQIKTYEPLPEEITKTVTLDNGSEHYNHKRVEQAIGIKAYFADPYSPWQRGGNENINLWIRYYFPKGTDFSKVSYEEIKAVEWELNNRPRKRLGFLTPLEVFSKNLELLQS